jgi:hypothetical protein
MTLKVYRRSVLSSLAALVFTGACSSQPPDTPGTNVSFKLPADQQAEFDALTAKLKASENLTAAEFADQYKVPFASGLSYDPTKAQNLPLIQASALALDAGETSKLGEHGFVISARQNFPTFAYGYASIYAQDLPVFISADSILFAVHRSYDDMLKELETESLIPELGTLLDDMRSSLSSGGASALGAQARADADLFLAVAKGLLIDAPAAPVAGGSEADIQELVTGAKAASGAQQISLFGSAREVDFSQFKPRGHYTDSEEFQQYFRAMMWLGRMDFRLLEAQPDLTLKFRRRQLEGALALGALMSGATKDRWGRIDSTITAFVGEHDYMIVPQLDSLLVDLKVTDLGALAKVSDETISQAILEGKYGTQRISSHIMVNGVGKGTMPLSSSFALFGQRYVVDSHVFSNVVYDRVQHGDVPRMMPNPLDVAFAALKNNQAGQLLGSELEQYKYAPDLNAMRILVDAHPQDYWEGNLYNLWLSSLQTLSPSADVADPATAGVPSVMATEAWGRRLLNAQLASWAELRHDTILYAKQSYGVGAACEFPDAYVEPNPAFFKAIDAYAQRGKELVGKLDLKPGRYAATAIPAYFDQLHTTVSTLATMAEQERTGTPFTAEQMAFINEAVTIGKGCDGGPVGADGWYGKLFFLVSNAVRFDPTIADVHTQPDDEAGNRVGRVLHVGTGYARLLTVTVDTCNGPRAYVGLASSYMEKITENFERLDDPTWASTVVGKDSPTPVSDVPWVKDLIAP